MKTGNNQHIGGQSSSPEHENQGSPKANNESEMFDEQYFEARKEEERLEHLKNRDAAAYAYEIERQRLRMKLLAELTQYIKEAADITIVEKEKVLKKITKFTIDELSNLKETIVKGGVREGIAELKRRKDFIKGSNSSD